MKRKKGKVYYVLESFFKVNTKQIPMFCFVICMLIACYLLQAILNYNIGGLVDNLTNWNQKKFVGFIIRICLLEVIYLGCNYVSTYYSNKVSELSIKNIRIHTYDCLMKANMRWLDKVKIGDIISRVNLDLEAMVTMVNHFLTWEMANILMFIIGTIACLILNFKLTIVSIIAFPLLGVLQVMIGTPISKYATKRATYDGKANSKFMDLVNGHTIVKIFNKDKLQGDYINQVDGSMRVGRKSALLELGIYSVQALISFIPYLIMYCTSVYLINRGEFTVGKMVSFTLIFVTLATPMNSISGQIRFIMDSLGLASRVFELWNIESESSDGVVEGKDVKDVVEMKNVKFSYSEASEKEADGKLILDDFSLSIEKGSKVAIVGNSGEGKSTIFKLMLGIYKNYNGSMKVFGTEVKDWNALQLRKKISYVGQNGFCLQDSIFNNIKLGKLEATDEEVMNVVRLFGLDSLDVNKQIGEHGIMISGGQKQRICLARAFLKNTDLFILDEPTSALDTESEYYVSKAINEYLKDKTCLIIAHRLSTIRNVDKILYLQKGKIVEEGTFQELTERDSFTRKMFLHQLKEEKQNG